MRARQRGARSGTRVHRLGSLHSPAAGRLDADTRRGGRRTLRRHPRFHAAAVAPMAPPHVPRRSRRVPRPARAACRSSRRLTGRRRAEVVTSKGALCIDRAAPHRRPGRSRLDDDGQDGSPAPDRRRAAVDRVAFATGVAAAAAGHLRDTGLGHRAPVGPQGPRCAGARTSRSDASRASGGGSVGSTRSELRARRTASATCRASAR
jgi:hypothetical protein